LHQRWPAVHRHGSHVAVISPSETVVQRLRDTPMEAFLKNESNCNFLFDENEMTLQEAYDLCKIGETAIREFKGNFQLGIE
jgi:hypothetical protein